MLDSKTTLVRKRNYFLRDWTRDLTLSFPVFTYNVTTNWTVPWNWTIYY